MEQDKKYDNEHKCENNVSDYVLDVQLGERCRRKRRGLLTLARLRSASSGSGGGWSVLGSGKNVKVSVGGGGVVRLEDAEVVCVVVDADEWGGVLDCTAAPKIALC